MTHMSNDNDGFDLQEAIENGANAVREYITVLGVQREQYQCPDCDVVCEPAYTYDPARAAFDKGESPSWYCEGCDTHYVREVSDESHTMDLYGRE